MNIAHMVKKASQQLTTVPVSVSTAAASGASGVGGAVSGAAGGSVVGGGTGGTKENLYVIALPPDQLRYLLRRPPRASPKRSRRRRQDSWNVLMIASPTLDPRICNSIAIP